MKLRDILDRPYENIMARTNSPFEDEEPEGCLFGYCSWDGENLISEDGDNYYLDEEIYRWKYDEKHDQLIYWFRVEWSICSEEDK